MSQSLNSYKAQCLQPTPAAAPQIVRPKAMVASDPGSGPAVRGMQGNPLMQRLGPAQNNYLSMLATATSQSPNAAPAPAVPGAHDERVTASASK